eukprot:184599-Chlamydomonas_euryale.AAC.2
MFRRFREQHIIHVHPTPPSHTLTHPSPHCHTILTPHDAPLPTHHTPRTRHPAPRMEPASSLSCTTPLTVVCPPLPAPHHTQRPISHSPHHPTHNAPFPSPHTIPDTSRSQDGAGISSVTSARGRVHYERRLHQLLLREEQAAWLTSGLPEQ